MLVSRFASLCIKVATVTAGGDHFTVQTAQSLQSIFAISNDSSQTKNKYTVYPSSFPPQVRFEMHGFYWEYSFGCL